MIIYESIFKKYGLSPTQQEILKIVGQGKVVLEIGASTGYMTKAFLDNGCIVDIIEKDKPAIKKIPGTVRKIINQSVEELEFNGFPPDFDFIVMADVLEHLVNPEQTLKKLLKISSSETKLIISLPNIACWTMRKQLFFKGDFEYQASGLLDKTHLHFYTVNTLPKILLSNGWQVDQLIGTITRLPFEGLFGRIPFIYHWLVEKYKNLAYYHFLVVASKKNKPWDYFSNEK